MKIRPPPTNVSQEVAQWMREAMSQINAISEGAIVGTYNAATAAPTTGTWAKGDFIANIDPSELGMPLSKYIITGWQCTVSGSPGTWLQRRALTGN